MKVVVDTNVFINAVFHEDKYAKEILNKHYKKEIVIAINEDCETELFVIFMAHAEKFKTDIMRLFRLYKQLTSALWNTEEVMHNIKSSYSKDIYDNKFIDCYIESNANYIITYNTEHFIGFEKDIVKDYGCKLNIISPYNFILECNKLKMQKNLNSRRI